MTALAVLAALLVGATPQDTAAYRLRPVEVTVTRASAIDLRVAAPVSVIGRAEIQRGQPTVGLEEALAIVPGVMVNNRYNFALGSRIAIRGQGARAAFGVRGIRLMADGIPLTMPDGQANLNNIDLASAGRIEVLRGPSSSLYGNAAGGVISIETEPAPRQSFAGTVTAIRADLGRDQFDRLAKHQLKAGGTRGAFDYLLSGSLLESDGYREHSRAEQSNLNARVRYHSSENSRWTVLLNHADAPEAKNPGSLPLDSAAQRPTMAWPNNVRLGTGEAAQQTQGGLRFERTGARSRLDISAYGLTRSLENPVPTAYITLERKAGGARAVYNRAASLLGRAIGWTLGGDLELQADERLERNNALGQPGPNTLRDQTDRVTTIGPFAQADVQLSTQWLLTAGLRYDRLRFQSDDHYARDGDNSGERTLSALSPRIALAFSAGANTTLYASAATAFQTPTITELINTPPPAGSTTVPGGFNPNLDPQRALNLELGLKGQLHERLRYEVAAYQLILRDALVSFQIAGIPERSFFRNSGKTRNNGLELAATALITSGLMLDAAYTFSDFVFVDDGLADRSFEGNEVPGVAPHHVFGRLRWQPHHSTTIELEDEYTSSFFANDANTATNAAAHVVDLRASFELDLKRGALRPFIGINNVFDERYNSSVVINAAGNPARYFEPAPGKNLYFGVSVGFGGL